jgi:hypothetical protein
MARCAVNALLELERLGYRFALDGDTVRYAHAGARPDPGLASSLLADLREHRDEAVLFLRARCGAATEDTASPCHSWTRVTLIWPPDVQIAVVRDQWQRLPDGKIEATYTREELGMALAICGR